MSTSEVKLPQSDQQLYSEPSKVKRTEEERTKEAEKRLETKSGNNVDSVTQKYMQNLNNMGVHELKYMSDN